MSEATVKLDKDFYESDETNCTMQGTKDFRTAVNNGNEQRVQKKLLMFDLSYLYRHFKDKCPCDKLGLSKFADNRTQRCVLASSTRKRAVCVSDIKISIS
jgi:hypothetical protein